MYSEAIIGLLCLGKGDFEAVNDLQEDNFSRTAMGVGTVLSTETRRQHLALNSNWWLLITNTIIVRFSVRYVHGFCLMLPPDIPSLGMYALALIAAAG